MQGNMWYLPNLSCLHCFFVNTGKWCLLFFPKKHIPGESFLKHLMCISRSTFVLCVCMCSISCLWLEMFVHLPLCWTLKSKGDELDRPGRVSCPVFLWGAVSFCPAALPPETTGTSAPAAPLPIHWRRQTWWPHLTLCQIWRTEEDN